MYPHPDEFERRADFNFSGVRDASADDAVVPRRPAGSQRSEAVNALTPTEVLYGVFERLPSVISITLLSLFAAAVIVFALPDKFTSDGLMYVRLGRGALSVDPTATTAGSAGVSVQETRSAEVMSVAEMINSREIAERVVERIGIEAIDQPYGWLELTRERLELLWPKKSVDPPGALTVDWYRAQLRYEEAIKKVRQWLSINTPKVGYTVGVTVNGPDPLLVQSVVQAVMDEYKGYHVEAHRSDGSLEFFEQQVAQSETAAIEAREQLQASRADSGWSSIESAESSLRERIVSLEIALDEAESLHAQSLRRGEALKDRLVATREWIPTEVTKGVANVAGDTMRTQLFDEQVVESEQLATLKPTHPRYRLLQEKMRRNAEIVTGENDPRELTRESLNPIWQQLESEFAMAYAGSEGLGSRCKSLRESLAAARQELARLNREAVKLATLKWRADIAERKFIEHAKSLEEARILFELDRKQMSDVSVIQDASLNLKKVGPPRTLLAIIGGLLGMALGVFQAVLRTTPRPVPLAPIGRLELSHEVRDSGVLAPRRDSPHRRAQVMPSSEVDAHGTQLNGVSDAALQGVPDPRRETADGSNAASHTSQHRPR